MEGCVMKRIIGSKIIILFALAFLFKTLSGISWAQSDLNNESWSSQKPGRYNNESWSSQKPGRYNNESWSSQKPGRYDNESWRLQKPGRYDNISWRLQKPGRYNDKSWRPKKIPCPKPYIKQVKPKATFVGKEIVIDGRRFGEDLGEIIFNEDIPAEIVSWRDRQIEVLVPEGAITGNVKVIKTCTSGSGEFSRYIKIKSPPLNEP
jgi:hypothetical protein